MHGGALLPLVAALGLIACGGGSPGDLPADAGSPSGGDAGADAGRPSGPDGGATRCSAAPECETVEGTVVEHRMEALDGCAFILQEPREPAAGMARADALLEKAGTAVTLADVLENLNREGRSGVTADTALRMREHDYVGFRWDSGDEQVSYWYSQGVTGSSDARADGHTHGRRLLLVSWYHRTDARPTKGARVSLVDFTDPSAIRYRHLLLVTPTGDGADVDFGPAEYASGDALHAGGIVWLGDLLYVADTRVGLRVFDLSRIFEVTHTDANERIGFSDGRMDAHGYRYAIPQIARYRLAEGSCPVRFSFAGLDRSADPPLIVTGEYASGHPNGRVVRWPVDPDTGWLLASDGLVHAWDAVIAAQSSMQGAITHDGVYYISSGAQVGPLGRLYRTRPGLESAVTAWPAGCEDLYVERDTGLIWTTTEFPELRDTLGIPLQGR